jgi:hypothetical protein
MDSRAPSGGGESCTVLVEIEHRHAGLDLGLEPVAVDQLAFERGEETLPHGIVETIIHRAHRRPHCDLAVTFAEGE